MDLLVAPWPSSKLCVSTTYIDWHGLRRYANSREQTRSDRSFFSVTPNSGQNTLRSA